MAQNVLITGANRGIGLALAQQYRRRGWSVIGVCRHSSAELEALGVEVISGIDVSEPTSLQKLQQTLAARALHLLINNAGVLSSESLGTIEYGDIEHQLQVNALGPLRVTEALLPNLEAGVSEGSCIKVAMITSRMGSIADNSSGGLYGYRMSKAALNAAAKSLALDLKPRGIAVALLHPGMVSTGMVDFHGDVTPEVATAGLVQRIDELTLETTGSFWHAKGELLPW